MDTLTFKGHIIVREVPASWTEADVALRWKKEREQFPILYETHNLLTAAGRTQLLGYCGASGAVTPFAQYFAVGNFPINTVFPLDTSVQGELYRAAPTLITSSGNTIDISMFLNGSQGNGILTNCGIFGNNATATSGSGMLMTHALFNFTKTAGQQVTCDYLITLN